ncbi:MAG: beta-ketoacyl-[acyl-carrier-protein] synthase II [Acidobacteria bacterium]|nr:MAG: beta-ketoacyl-[acyl-carrier-protein] synthase II [Acidobacteriota bacterium]
MRADRRVVVTGVGLVSPVGIGTEESWAALKAGRSGAGPITLFDASQHSTRFACEVKGFDPLRWVEKKDVKKMDRFIQFAVAAAEFALTDSGLRVGPDNRDMVGVYIGSGIGGFATIEREHTTLMERGPSRISPFFIVASIVNLASGWISIRSGARGPNSATCTACTTSAHAVGDSYRLIQRGEADAMIAGGSEAAITPLGVGGFAAMRALSTRNEEPEKASRPFDKDRDGFVIGEGAGVLILEEMEAARRRGAHIYCEVVGYGMSSDAHHISAPCEDGDGAYRVMMRAIKDAGISPGDIGYINVHGTSTPPGDKVEVVAIKRVFGEHARKLPISSTKSMTGHLLGAAGGLEAGVTALALRDQVLPPTINYTTPDPECDLDIVPNEARRARLEYALSNSFGFGGTNGALIFKRYEG